MLVCARLADKYRRRGPFILFAFTIQTIGCIVLKLVPPGDASPVRSGRYAALVLLVVGQYIILPLNL